ncbi:MAG: hypothetical protein EA403_09690 [Spirochaetaceae bacterium]|nr:MAG: hypothetical protein EA403_09690 [Spirochaetaceae bacterium]
MQQWDAAALQGTPRSDAPRTTSPSPSRAVDEAATAAAGELPAWASQAMASAGISTAGMERAAVEQVAQRVQSDARFREQLLSAIAAVQRAPATRPSTSGTAGGTTSGTDPGGPALTGDSAGGMIQWSDGAGRGGIPREPRITAAMFGGSVPARTEFVVLFDVGPNGSVIPGSIVFQTRSGYTRVNEEVRRTISGWTFQPKAGASVETAIVTLIVFREDVL